MWRTESKANKIHKTYEQIPRRHPGRYSGALAARSAVLGAQLNVRINAAGLADREAADRLCAEAEEIAAKAITAEAEVLKIANSKIA